MVTAAAGRGFKCPSVRSGAEMHRVTERRHSAAEKGAFGFRVSTVQGDFCLQGKVFLSTPSEHCVFQNSRPYLGQQFPSILSYPTTPQRSS